MRDQNKTHEDRIVLITNDERRMIVRALGLLETALNIEEVEEDLEESDISTHDNYIELYFCEKYKPFGE